VLFSQDGWTALHFGAWAGRAEIVQELLRQGADLHLQDKVGWGLLFHAFRMHFLSVNKACCSVAKQKIGDMCSIRHQQEASDSALAQVGRTPLHLASLRGQAEVVGILCDSGAHINARDSDGIAPIHKAVVQSSTEVAEQLIARGADVNLALPVRFLVSRSCCLLHTLAVCCADQETEASTNACDSTCMLMLPGVICPLLLPGRHHAAASGSLRGLL
jgi:ankyrin repeat protein